MATKTKAELKAKAKEQREEIAALKTAGELVKAEYEAYLEDAERQFERTKDVEAAPETVAEPVSETAAAVVPPIPEPEDPKYLKEPVVYMAVKGKGDPVREHDLVLIHDQTLIINNQVVRNSGKMAHFNPMYSTAVREEVEILDRKVKRGAFMGLKIISLTAERKQIGEMPRGVEQIDAMRALASDDDINKLVKLRVKGQSNYMDLTRGEAQGILTELQVRAGKKADAGVAKKVSERARMRDTQEPLVSVGA